MMTANVIECQELKQMVNALRLLFRKWTDRPIVDQPRPADAGGGEQARRLPPGRTERGQRLGVAKLDIVRIVEPRRYQRGAGVSQSGGAIASLFDRRLRLLPGAWQRGGQGEILGGKIDAAGRKGEAPSPAH